MINTDTIPLVDLTNAFYDETPSEKGERDNCLPAEYTREFFSTSPMKADLRRETQTKKKEDSNVFDGKPKHSRRHLTHLHE
jgi:hypothetical protein